MMSGEFMTIVLVSHAPNQLDMLMVNRYNQGTIGRYSGGRKWQ